MKKILWAVPVCLVIGMSGTVFGQAAAKDIHDEVEQTTTANDGLAFNGGIYQYNWKTSKSTTGCFRFELKLTDGSLHVVLIRLR